MTLSRTERNLIRKSLELEAEGHEVRWRVELGKVDRLSFVAGHHRYPVLSMQWREGFLRYCDLVREERERMLTENEQVA